MARISTGRTEDLISISLRFNKHDLAAVDAKAERYSMTRSALIKFLSLNGELTVSMPAELKKPIS